MQPTNYVLVTTLCLHCLKSQPDLCSGFVYFLDDKCFFASDSSAAFLAAHQLQGHANNFATIYPIRPLELKEAKP